MSKGFISKLFGGGDDDSPSREKNFVRRDDLFRSAFDQAPVGIAFSGTDGQWLQFNDRFVKMLGFPREELLRTSMRELTHAEDRKIEAPHVRRLTTGEIESYTIDKRLLLRTRKYGSFRVSVSRCSKGSGELEYYEYVVAPADSTAPREGSGWLERVIENVDDFAIIRATQEGTISGWSKGAEKIFGYKASEVLTKPRTMLYRDADAFERKHDEEVRQAMKAGLFNAESWRVGKDGFAIWTHVTLVTVKQEDGRIEIIEIVRQPSHVRSNPAHEQFRQRSEQLLSEAKAAHDAVQRKYNELADTNARETATLRTDVARLQVELRKREGVEQTLRESFAELSQGSEETYRELKIMAEALKKEMAKRRELEQMLAEARSEINATNAQWQEDLDRFAAKQEQEVPLVAVPPPPTAAPAFEDVDRETFLSTLLQFENGRQSGTLIARHGSVDIRVHFRDGAVIACTSNQKGMPLGEMLVDRGIITDDDRNRALEIQSHTNIAFGRVLLLINAVSQDQLIETMTERTRLELAQLFGWDHFSYAFVTDESPASKLVPLKLSPTELLDWLTAPPAAVEEHYADEDDTLVVSPSRDEHEEVVEPREEIVERGEEVVETPEPEVIVPEAAVEVPLAALPAETTPAFIGNSSKRAKKIHRPECRAVAKIPEKSRVELPSLEEAMAEGFERCSLCMKEAKEAKPKKVAAPRKEETAKKEGGAKRRTSKKKAAAEATPAAEVN